MTFLGEPRAIPAHARLFDASSPARWLLRFAFSATSRSGVRRVLTRAPSSEDVEAVADALAVVRDPADENLATVTSVTVQWRLGDHRPARAYVTACNDRGEPVCFAKLAARSDRAALEREHSLLTDLQERPLADWEVPRPFRLADTEGGRTGLALSCIPTPISSLPWSWVAALVPIRRRAPTDRDLTSRPGDELSWLRQGLDTTESLRARALLESASSGSVRCRLVHGDLRPGNAVLAGGRTWLLDWELGDRAGPHLTDVVAQVIFAPPLARRGTGPDIVRRTLKAIVPFVHGAPEDEEAVVLALAYLASRGQRTAKMTLDAWDEVT